MKCGIEIDILDVTILNIDSAELFTSSFICLRCLLSIFTSRLRCYFHQRIILSSKSNFYYRTALFFIYILLVIKIDWEILNRTRSRVNQDEMTRDSVIVGLWKVKSGSDNGFKKFYLDANFTIFTRSMILIILSNVLCRI